MKVTLSTVGFLAGLGLIIVPIQTILAQQNVLLPMHSQIVDRGANQQTWEWEAYGRGQNDIITNSHKYIELATGLNHLVNGQWIKSKEEIDILPDGTASATNGQHQAYFPSDIYNGVIEVVTPDGKHLKSRPLGLFYDDGTKTVLIAVLTNSIGELVGFNQVIYPNAFVGFNADLRYTYRKSGFEQDVVLREQPPTPDSFGLNPKTTRLQLLTEFFGTADPVQTSMAVNQRDGLRDTMLAFGQMKMIHGKAFSINESAQRKSAIGGTPTCKNWLHLEGRTFLVEELPLSRIAEDLDKLPVATTARYAGIVSTQRWLPASRLAKATKGKIKLAKRTPKTGLVLDYAIVSSSVNNFTFQGNTTYLISDVLNLDGTTTFEGGTVLKYPEDGSSELNCNGSIICQTRPYNPSILTSINDNSAGETIIADGPSQPYMSSGTPAAGSSTYILQSGDSSPLSYMRFSYAGCGVSQFDSQIRDSQFFDCNVGVYVLDSEIGLHNVLFAGCVQATWSDVGAYVRGEHITMDNSYDLDTYEVTNSVFASCSLSYGGGDYNGFYNTTPFGSHYNIASVSPFQTNAAGYYYLASSSSFRNAGTMNIDPAVLADIAAKTTYPSVVYSSATISGATDLSPQAERDMDAPDLGYHYDPLDYVFTNTTINAPLDFTPGTAVGWYGRGLTIGSGAAITFSGTDQMPDYLVRCNTVQEQNMENGGDRAIYALTGAAQINATFTRFSALPDYLQNPSGAGAFFYIYNTNSAVNLNNCEFWNGSLYLLNANGTFNNCLFDRTGFMAVMSLRGPANLQNCTMRGGSLALGSVAGSVNYYNVFDSAFDGTAITSSVNDNQFDYNAFRTNAVLTRLAIHGAHDVLLTNFNWQSGVSGNYYLPSDSPLIDAGNDTVDNEGLAGYTTQTNQAPDSGTVDIGYHYAATNAANDSLGTNFWLAFFYMDDGYSGGLSLFISSSVGATGAVMIPGLGFTNTFSVAAGVALPRFGGQGVNA